MFTPHPADHLLPLKSITRGPPTNIHSPPPDTIFARLSGLPGMMKKGVDAQLVEHSPRRTVYNACVALALKEEAIHDWPSFVRDVAVDLGHGPGSVAALITKEKEVYMLFRQAYQARELLSYWGRPGFGSPYIHQMGDEAFQDLINRPFARFPYLYLSHEYEDKGRWRYRGENLIDQLHSQGKVVWLEVSGENGGTGLGDFVEARVAFSTTEERKKAWDWMRTIMATCRQETLISAEEAKARTIENMEIDDSEAVPGEHGDLALMVEIEGLSGQTEQLQMSDEEL